MIASVLIGTHPPAMAVKALVRVGELFGIAEGTIRVALSRMAADGELLTENGQYRLGSRLEARQADQDRERWPRVVDWPGTWEIVLGPGTNPERNGLSATLQARHLAPAGGRTWMRPANLSRSPGLLWPAGCRRLEGRPTGEEVAEAASDASLVATLWDLEGWERLGDGLLSAYDRASDPAARFVVAAAIIRHVRTDPLLPDSLVSARWPADRLRDTFGRFTEELQTILATYR